MTDTKYHYDFALKLNDAVSTHAIQFRLVPEGSRVLDVGCHTGILGAALRQKKHCTVTGIDNDAEALKEAEERLDEVHHVNLEAVGWSAGLDKNYAVILFGDVLEHTKNPLAILQEAKSLLAKNGIALVSLPNVANLRVRLGLLRGKFDYAEAGILDHGHLRFFTIKSARELMQSAGYRIVSETYSGYSLPKWLIDRFPALLAVNIVLVGDVKIRELSAADKS